MVRRRERYTHRNFNRWGKEERDIHIKSLIGGEKKREIIETLIGEEKSREIYT